MRIRFILGVFVLAVTFVSAPLWADSSSPTMVVYAPENNNQPVHRIWSGSSWGSAVNLPSVGGFSNWLVLRNCPTRNETACATLDQNNEVNVVFFNGSTWGSVSEVGSDTSQNSARSMDLCYESVAGDLLIAYWDATNTKVGFCAYSGSSISVQSLLTLPSNNTVNWLQLFAHPATDDLFLLALNSIGALYACKWDGGAWGSVTTLESSVSADSYECFSGACESSSGIALVAYGENASTSLKYRTWTGSGWSAEASGPNVGAVIRWVRLVADPASDAALCGILDADDTLNATPWNGSSWGSAQALETHVQLTDRRQFDIAYELGGTKGLVMYTKNGQNRPIYRTWSGSAWSGESMGSNAGNNFTVTALKTGTVTGEVFTLDFDNGNDLNARHWSGSSLSSHTELNGALEGGQQSQSFMISTPVTVPLTPANIPYSHDFETAMGPEWSNRSITSNAAYTNFAGRHRTTPLKLALNTTVGETYRIAFDFYAIDSWDGIDGDGGQGPDYFQAAVDGATLFSHTLVHEWPAQGMSYPYPYDQKGNYGFNGSYEDAIYRGMEVSFTAASSVSTISFVASLVDGSDLAFNDESWGIDDISVQTARFVDVSAARGFDVQTTSTVVAGSGVNWADLDNDGDVDALLGGNSTSRLALSTSAGAGFTMSSFGGGASREQFALLDFDNDGDLDVWIAEATTSAAEKLYLNAGAASFSDGGNRGLTGPSTSEGAAAADVNADGRCDIVCFASNNNWIGHHQGDTAGTLIGTSAASYGLNDSGDYGTRGFCAAADVNNDNRLDFYYHFNNGKLFVSDGDGTFTENAFGISVATGSSDEVGSAWADYDNDGDMDFFCARLDECCTGYLWRNDRNWTAATGTFTNVTTSAGLTLNTTADYTPDLIGTRSSAWGDYDNDGDLDLLIVGGSGNNYLYQNQGGGAFQRAAEGATLSGVFADAAFVDYDNDGDLDIALTRVSGTAVLLQNRTNNTSYLKVRLIGRGAGGTNRAAIGTRVELWNAAGTTRLGRRDIGVARGFGGTEPLWAHFGGVSPATSYKVKVYFLSRSVSDPVVFDVMPNSASTTIGGTTIPRMVTVQESTKVRIIQWSEVRNKP